MSRQLALDTIRLRPTRQIAHTEYSLGYHPELIRKFTGLAPDEPGALRAFYDRWGLDFNWSSHDGLHAVWSQRWRGRAGASSSAPATTCPAIFRDR